MHLGLRTRVQISLRAEVEHAGYPCRLPKKAGLTPSLPISDAQDTAASKPPVSLGHLKWGMTMRRMDDPSYRVKEYILSWPCHNGVDKVGWLGVEMVNMLLRLPGTNGEHRGRACLPFQCQGLETGP